jgi:hypothetical protein
VPVLPDERRRNYTDVEGLYWEVREAKPLQYDRRGASLIFESMTQVRRVRNYPADWYELSAAALEELSHGK